MTPTLTGFKASPDRGRGLARDMRVRWAFEEVGRAYDMRLVTFEEMKSPEYLTLHPFGQIPAYIEDDLVLFESGSIILRLAEGNTVLLPADSKARARAITWMFAALNTMELPIVSLGNAKLLEKDRPWFQDRLELLEKPVHGRLKQLSNYLADSDWLDGAFSAGDLLMITVLRRLDGSGLLEQYPKLMAYIARGEARPAYQRAFAAQLQVFKDSQK